MSRAKCVSVTSAFSHIRNTNELCEKIKREQKFFYWTGSAVIWFLNSPWYRALSFSESNFKWIGLIQGMRIFLCSHQNVLFYPTRLYWALKVHFPQESLSKLRLNWSFRGASTKLKEECRTRTCFYDQNIILFTIDEMISCWTCIEQ